MLYLYSEEKAKAKGVHQAYKDWARVHKVDLSLPAVFVERIQDRLFGEVFRVKYPSMEGPCSVAEEVYNLVDLNKNLKDYL